MQAICSYGSAGEPVGNHQLYPEKHQYSATPSLHHSVWDHADSGARQIKVPATSLGSIVPRRQTLIITGSMAGLPAALRSGRCGAFRLRPCPQPSRSYNAAVLDIKLIREQPDWARQRLATRGAGDEKRVDELLALDEQRRKLVGEVEGLKAERN